MYIYIWCVYTYIYIYTYIHWTRTRACVLARPRRRVRPPDAPCIVMIVVRNPLLKGSEERNPLLKGLDYIKEHGHHRGVVPAAPRTNFKKLLYL